MREAKATKAISLIVAINVCPTGTKEGRGLVLSYDLYLLLLWLHYAYAMLLASITARQSTVQHSTT